MSITKLIEFTKKEKIMHNILPYERNLIKDISKEIELQEEYLDSIEKTTDNIVIIEVKELEIERIKYILKTYFKTRLFKIENNFFSIIKFNLSNLWSTEEEKYFKAFTQNYMKNMNNSFFKYVNENYGIKLLYGNITGDSKVKLPYGVEESNKKTDFVIAKATCDFNDYKIEDKLISFSKDTFIISKLHILDELIANKKVYLVLD